MSITPLGLQTKRSLANTLWTPGPVVYCSRRVVDPWVVGGVLGTGVGTGLGTGTPGMGTGTLFDTVLRLFSPKTRVFSPN